MKKIAQVLSMVFYISAMYFGLWFLFALTAALISPTKDLNTWEGFFSVISLGLFAIGLSLKNLTREKTTPATTVPGRESGDIIGFIIGKLLAGVALFFLLLGLLTIIVGIIFNSMAVVIGVGVMMIGGIAGIVVILLMWSVKKIKGNKIPKT